MKWEKHVNTEYCWFIADNIGEQKKNMLYALLHMEK